MECPARPRRLSARVADRFRLHCPESAALGPTETIPWEPEADRYRSECNRPEDNRRALHNRSRRQDHTGMCHIHS